MDVLARLAPGREFDVDDFADITTVPAVRVDFAPGGFLRVAFAGALTESEAWRVRVRIESVDAAAEQGVLDIAVARANAAAQTPCGCTACDALGRLVLLLAARELGDA